MELLTLLYKMRSETKRIILHDSHTEPPYDNYWLDDARKEALAMGLLDTGYHFIIERDGKVFEIRPRRLIGTHTPQNNLDSVGICLVGGRKGNHAVDNFADVQFDKLQSLVLELFDEFGQLELRGHDETLIHKRKGPVCPAFSMHIFRTRMMIVRSYDTL